MICDLRYANSLIENQGLDILVVSYGGSCSNLLVDTLEKNGYRCKCKIWHEILCHCPVYIKTNIPVIYIYDNPIKALVSMKNRGKNYWDTNQKKLSNNKNIKLSDENLLELMFHQFYSWIRERNKNMLVIKSLELFDHNIVNVLQNFLKRKIEHFPIRYIKPKTDISNITDKSLIDLFEKYKLQIEYINNYQ